MSDEPGTAPEAAPRPVAPAPADNAATAAAAGDTGATPAPPVVRRSLPARLVFRTPGSAYIAIAFAVFCVSFVGVASPWLTLVFLLPVAAFVYVLRTRTEVDADRVVVHRVLTRTVLPWSQVASLRVAEKGWIRAVRTDGGEIALPTVRTRHLPAIALITRGRITDPTESADHGPV